MSLLFENLMTFAESSKSLIERDILKVHEFNKLKYALNKSNTMKTLFTLHPGKLEVNGYNVRIPIFLAFNEYEKNNDTSYKNWDVPRNHEYTSYNTARDGVGASIYEIRINLIDNSYKISDTYLGWDFDRYIKNLNNLDHYQGISIDDVKTHTKEIVEKSKDDVKTVLDSKNFIYNLSKKLGDNDVKNDGKYTLDLEESTILNEDFDPSMPNWLKVAIKRNNDEYSRNHKDPNYNIPLDTLKWVVEPFPEKGKLNSVSGDEIYALLIDRSGDDHLGYYVVYAPALNIGSTETIEINGRYRKIDSMSLKALAPYVKEWAKSVDYVEDKQKMRDMKIDRVTANQNDEFTRHTDDGTYYSNSKPLDKSGYVIDANKYKKKLAQLNIGKYEQMFNDLVTMCNALQQKTGKYTMDTLINHIFKGTYSRPSSNRQTVEDLLFKAWDETNDAKKLLDDIQAGKESYWSGTPAYKEFINHVNKANENIQKAFEIIDNYNEKHSENE